jgi:predicted PurR-regulated permease PerM
VLSVAAPSCPACPTSTTLSDQQLARTARHDQLALRIGLAVLVLAAVVILAPFTPWLMLAAWSASLARPALVRLSRVLRGGRRAAALLTLVLFVVVVGPIVLALLAVALDALRLWRSISASGSSDEALRALVSGDAGDPLRFSVPDLSLLARAHVAEAFGVASGLAGFLADAALGLFVFFSASYIFLIDGPSAFGWVERNTPVATRHIERLAAAFDETGRGLLVSVGLSGLVQALLATVTYFILGVPRALVLGLVTLFASLIPSVGTALVWVPVTIALAVSGRTNDAWILGAVGICVISTSDNLLRPVFARWGKLDLHGLVVLLAMLGGLVIVGAWGLLLGPVIVRLALEALRIAREEHAFT